MNYLSKLAVFLLLTLATLAVRGEEPTVMRLSLQQAQDYALQHNYTLMNATLSEKKAEAAKWEALSSMLPQVKASFDYSSMCGYEMQFGAMHIPMNPYGTFGITASIAVTAQQIVGTMMSSTSKELSEISRMQTELSTLINVKNIYVSILAMEDVVGLLDSSLANMETLERTTIESVKAGAAEQISADKISVQVASMRNSIQANRRALNLLYNSLILQIGADVNSKLELTTPLDELLDISKAAQLTNATFDMSRNYDYQMLEKNEKLSHDQLLLAWLGFTPTLSAYYQYNAKTYFGKDEGMNMTPPNMIGAGVSLPLFQSGTRIAKIKQANIDYQKTLNSRRQAEDGLQVSHHQLCYDLLNALETYQTQKSNLEVCKRVLDNTTEKYKFGHASGLEVTNASTDIISAQSNYIQAVMSVINAQLSLEQLLGGQR